jgi:apolipoprotein N-acyltransferase
MSASTRTTTKPNLRITVSSVSVRQVLAAAVGALLLALAFPKVNAAWLAPVGAAALFWAWEGASWKRAFSLGWFTGLIFFTINFWWWSTSIKEEVGVLAYAAVVAGAALEALAIGATGALAALIYGRGLPALAPIGVAAAFAALEWVRSVGLIGVPFGALGYTQADTPLKIFAAFGGTTVVTFVVCLVGAYLADAFRRRTIRSLAVCIGALACALAIAWWNWPARTLPAPRIPVASVQGNIAQSLKWQEGSLERAVARYTTLTEQATTSDPKLIVWPETVIAIRGEGLNQDAALLTQFTQLARSANATIVVGSINVEGGNYYNSLFFFSPQGLQSIYNKRQLVPFAEFFPGKNFLGWLPYIGQLNGGFSEGNVAGVYPTLAGLSVAPLICWESAFADLAHAQVAQGAGLLVVSTDDAWFGTSSGPYQHAQIAQLRAVESGMYVVRAAATGVSGIIAPDGTWRTQIGLEREGIAQANVAAPVGSVFARIGPLPIALLLMLTYLIVLGIGVRRREA